MLMILGWLECDYILCWGKGKTYLQCMSRYYSIMI